MADWPLFSRTMIYGLTTKAKMSTKDNEAYIGRKRRGAIGVAYHLTTTITDHD